MKSMSASYCVKYEKYECVEVKNQEVVLMLVAFLISLKAHISMLCLRACPNRRGWFSDLRAGLWLSSTSGL